MSRTDWSVAGPPGDEVEVRDIERIREKITFSLEPTHVALAVAALFVLLAAAFFAGLVVARSVRDGRGERADRGPVALMASSEAVPQLGPAIGEAPAKAAPARSSARDRISTSASVLPAPSIPDATARGADLEALPMGARLGAVEVLFAPDARLVAEIGPVTTTARRDAVEVPIAFGPEVPPAVVAEVKPAAAVPPSTVNRQPSTVGRKPAPDAGPFEVQVRSYREEDKAREYAAELVGRGYKARVVPFEVDGVAWYRIRIGHFKSSTGAAEFASRFNGREDAKAIPVQGAGK